MDHSLDTETITNILLTIVDDSEFKTIAPIDADLHKMIIYKIYFNTQDYSELIQW